MKPVSDETVERQLRWRYATKKFDPAQTIPDDDWRTLEQALVLAPSSYGLQPWRFVVVTDPAVRAGLREASWNQPQITDASHLVVFAVRRSPDAAHVDRHLARTAEVRGQPVEALAGLRGRLVGFLERPGFDATAWAARQVYIALGMFLCTAAMLGIDACPMEGIEPAKYDAILGLDKEGYAALCVATAGYRAADDPYAAAAKVRFAPEDVITRVTA
jgi:nitroreductase